MSTGSSSSTLLSIRGTPVVFPYTPYAAQVEYMESVIDALNKKCNALLESPTGTGKTLCMLCATLAWAEQQREQALALNQVVHPHAGIVTSAHRGVMDLATSTVVPFRVVYCSRTHAQLTQVIRELRKTPYVVDMSLLASREHMCVHPEVSRMTNAATQNRSCNALRADRQCRFFNKVQMSATSTGKMKQMLWYDETAAEGGEEDTAWNPKRLIGADQQQQSTILDVEDLHKRGLRNGFCPYFYQRMVAKDAQLVFLPYSYVFDPHFRRQLPFSLEDAIVIVDEAHNIPSALHNNGSQNLTPLDVTNAIHEMTRAIVVTRNTLKESTSTGTINPHAEQRALDLEERFSAAKIMLVQLEDAIAEAGVNGIQRQQGDASAIEQMLPPSVAATVPAAPLEVVMPGNAIYTILASAGVNKLVWGGPNDEDDHPSNAPPNSRSKVAKSSEGLPSTLYEILVEAMTTVANGEGEAAGLSKVQLFLSNVFQSPSEVDVATACRTVLLGSSQPSSKGAASHRMPPQGGALHPQKKSVCWSLGFWCLDTTGAMAKAIRSVRSCLLTSGTLSPLDHFAAELGVPFPVTLKGKHVIGPGQLFASMLLKGPSGQRLNGSAANRQSEEYRLALGYTLLNIARSVPNGLLVFFPSYIAMHSATELWMAGSRSVKSSGSTIWGDLAELKELFVEPLESGELQKVVQGFQKAAERERGAILFAVCRGKVSEGVDFSDQHGRCVVVTGIPFANHGDLFVRLKREYLTQVAPSRPKVRGKLFTGDDWYRNEAMRAVNQCLGRVIRHRLDYGAVVMADERFVQQREGLSHWIADEVLVHSEFRETYTGLTKFFAGKKAGPRVSAPVSASRASSAPSAGRSGHVLSVPQDAHLAALHDAQQQQRLATAPTSPPAVVGAATSAATSSNEPPSADGKLLRRVASPFGALSSSSSTPTVVLVSATPQPSQIISSSSSSTLTTSRKVEFIAPPSFQRIDVSMSMNSTSSTSGLSAQSPSPAAPPALATAVAGASSSLSPASPSCTAASPSPTNSTRLSAKDYCEKLKRELTAVQYGLFRTALTNLVKMKPALTSSNASPAELRASLESMKDQFETIVGSLRRDVFEVAYQGEEVDRALLDFAQFVPDPLRAWYDHLLRKRRRSQSLS